MRRILKLRITGDEKEVTKLVMFLRELFERKGYFTKIYAKGRNRMVVDRGLSKKFFILYEFDVHKP